MAYATAVLGVEAGFTPEQVHAMSWGEIDLMLTYIGAMYG